MVILKNREEIDLIYKSANLVSKTLGLIASELKPGITSIYLDKLAGEYIRDNGGYPAFLGMYGFPNNLCISINENVVHGIPNNYIIKEGDIVSVDCGVYMNGYYGDHAYTFPICVENNEILIFLESVKKSMYKGINKLRYGNRIGDVSFEIQKYCEDRGYGVVRDLVGHGIGRNMHEEPQIPNYGRKGKGKLIKNGLVVAIEPMINMGSSKVFLDKNGWNIKTHDRSYSAHYEHNICVIDGNPKLLSTYKYIYENLGIISDEEDPYIYK